MICTEFSVVRTKLLIAWKCKQRAQRQYLRLSLWFASYEAHLWVIMTLRHFYSPPFLSCSWKSYPRFCVCQWTRLRVEQETVEAIFSATDGTWSCIWCRWACTCANANKTRSEHIAWKWINEPFIMQTWRHYERPNITENNKMIPRRDMCREICR